MTEDRNYNVKLIILIVSFIIVLSVSFLIGRYKIDPFLAFRIILSRIVKIKKTWTDTQFNVVVNVRFPRIACAALIGAALSVAGAAYQGMFRNPMVSPDLLGASTGAGFGAALGILFGFSYFWITFSAFIFGLIAVFLAFAVSKASRLRSTTALVLSGIMIGSLFSSGTGFVKLVADTESQLPAITYWLMGSLSSVKIRDLGYVWIPVCLGLIPIILLRWRINILTVSEAEARSMGVNVSKLRLFIIVCATLMTSASVSISGMIGWVGLVIPHLCRMIFSDDYRRLIPTSALMGATFLVLVDNIARVACSSEIPLGILTSFIGAPFFIFLIIKGGNSHEN